MPFAKSSLELKGRLLDCQTELGYGWLLQHPGKPDQIIDIPSPFEMTVVGGLEWTDVVVALVGRTAVRILDMPYSWAVIIARTDSVIDLSLRSVGCKLVLTPEPPAFSDTVHYPALNFVEFPRSPYWLQGSVRVKVAEQSEIK